MLLFAYFTVTLGFPLGLGVYNEWEHRYKTPEVFIPTQPLLSPRYWPHGRPQE